MTPQGDSGSVSSQCRLDQKGYLMRVLFRYFLFCAICTCSALPSFVVSAEYTGFKRLIVTDPVGGKPMDAVYFYPGVAVEKTPSTIGPYQIAAQKALNIVPGRYPVIVISHGNAGSYGVIMTLPRLWLGREILLLPLRILVITTRIRQGRGPLVPGMVVHYKYLPSLLLRSMMLN